VICESKTSWLGHDNMGAGALRKGRERKRLAVQQTRHGGQRDNFEVDRESLLKCLQKTPCALQKSLGGGWGVGGWGIGPPDTGLHDAVKQKGKKALLLGVSMSIS